MIFILVLFIIVPAVVFGIVLAIIFTVRTNNGSRNYDENTKYNNYDENTKYNNYNRKYESYDNSSPLSMAEIKGIEGERIIANTIGHTIPYLQYIVNDICFYDGNGGTCQIDHICINRFGIWVIETKNFSGMIFGKTEDKNWTQVKRNGEKKVFYNPVMQNQGHIEKLKRRISFDDEVKSVVVFVNADINNVSCSEVCSAKDLGKHIRFSFDKELSIEEMKKYYDEILQLKLKSRVTHKEHTNNVKRNQKMIEMGLCPRCGGRLITKKGTFGSFLACCHYPNCTFTKKEY